ncbi:DNA helicase [Trifolium repens]|nr:DNA helicase [Trifolium repens]
MLLLLSCLAKSKHFKRAASGVLPPKIQALMNCTYLFKVECKVAVSSRFDQSFRVRKICTDIVIINQFKSKWALEESVFVKNANEMNSLSALHDNPVDKGNIVTKDFQSKICP